MNKLINQLINQLAREAAGGLLSYDEDGFKLSEKEVKKFVELIVAECAKVIENRAPGQMGKEGVGWTNGYDDGLKTGAWLIKQHFGIEE